VPLAETTPAPGVLGLVRQERGVASAAGIWGVWRSSEAVPARPARPWRSFGDAPFARGQGYYTPHSR
jgi:hypothetical protein